MLNRRDVRAIGVEEELFLVDPTTWRVTAVAQKALRADAGDDEAEAEAELYQQQIETATDPTTDLETLRAGLVEARRGVADRAEAVGARVAAVSTPVMDHAAPEVTPGDRYRRIVQEYGALAQDALVCGMHVHIDVHDDAETVRVMDSIRPWLPLLLAVSANSPFHRGQDTGHASWRSQVWSRWPAAGTNDAFGDRAAYDATAGLLQDWGAALDPGMLYFDIRPAAAYPTLEIRVADVCTSVDDAVLVAALSRALVTTLAASEPAGRRWRGELLRAATWRAAKVGIGDRLVHPMHQELVPARDAIASLIELTKPALEVAGDLDAVNAMVEALFARGSGATRQRAVHERTGDLAAVVADLAERTLAD